LPLPVLTLAVGDGADVAVAVVDPIVDGLTVTGIEGTITIRCLDS
jgi:hypothetical protein